VGGGIGGAGMWGPTGWTRLFNTEFGNTMSWLLPGALVMGAVLLVLTIRARRIDRERAGLLLWGGSLVGTGLVISMAQGIIHPYYAVALAPPLGALIYLPTVGLLPPAIRELYGLRWSRYHEAALRGLGWLSRRIVPMLPAAWRYWPAARLAMAAPTPDRLHTPAQPKFTANELR